MVKGISLWKGGRKNKDFLFQDKIIKEYIERSGTGFLVHKYLGPYEQDPKDPTVSMPKDKSVVNELTIEDLVVLENRDRKYDKDLIELPGAYVMPEVGFDLSAFGILLSGDTIMVEFHTNDHMDKLGRRLMAGDVIEPVHMRDETPLDTNSKVIPKFYVVQECMRPPNGYGPTWWPHIWRAKCTPIVDTQEYRDILHNQETQKQIDATWMDSFGTEAGTGFGVVDPNIGNPDNEPSAFMSTFQKEQIITRLLDAAYREQVERREFFTRHLYMREKNSKVKTNLLLWIFDQECIPPNFGGDFIASGYRFPEEPCEGEYFIRRDYSPEALFKRIGPIWRRIEDEWRQEWVPAGRILQGYLHNEKITSVGPTEADTFPEKQALSDVVRPQADVLPDRRD